MKRAAGFLVIVLTALVVTAPASATPGFQAEITSIGPTLPGAASTLSVSVQVSNPSSVDIRELGAHFIISTSPLSGRSQIPQVLGGHWLPTYRLVEAGAASGIDLSSGASTTLTLRATPKQLGLLGNRPGAYVLGVQLDGQVSGRSVTERRVTLVPWLTGSVRHRLGVVTVWTLTAPPSRTVDGTFIDDSLAIAIGTGGQLRRQLDAMRTIPQAMWLIDPMLAESVQALATGARISTADNGVRATSDSEMQAAQQWLTDLRTAVSTGTVAALPMGDLDIRAAMKFHRLSLVRHALHNSAARLAAILQVVEVPLVVPLYGGAVSDSTWKFLRSEGATAAVVSDQAYASTQSQYTPTSAISVPSFGGAVIAADHTTSATPVTTGLNAASARQAFAAQLLMTFLERPNSARVITVAIPPTWMPDPLQPASSALNARWIAHASFEQATTAGTDSRSSTNAVATHAQRLQDVDLGRAVDQQRVLAHLTDDETFTATVTDAVVGTLSRWFTARNAEDRFSAITVAKLTALAQSVRVVTHGDIVFAAEKGVAPVTVANGLPVAIDLTLRATGFPSIRVQPRGLTTMHINAGKRVSVEVPTRVSGSGDAYLGLQLEARDRTPVADPVLLTVRSAAYARVAGYLVMGAFVLLLLMVIVNTARRIRGRGKGEANE